MGRKINEIGTLTVTQDKRVVFHERKLRNIYVAENESIFIEYEKVSSEGTIVLVETLPYDEFSKKAEDIVWELLDNHLIKE